jgi:hypothetical protein
VDHEHRSPGWWQSLSFAQMNFRFVGNALRTTACRDGDGTAEPVTDLPGGAVVPSTRPASKIRRDRCVASAESAEPAGFDHVNFDLAQAELISLVVFDAAGRKVQSLAEGTLPAGSHAFVWDGQNADRTAVSSGVYYYRLQTAKTTAVRSMLVIR